MRTPKQQPATPSPAAEHINQAAIVEAGSPLSAHAQHLAVVDKKFGDIVEYQRDRVVSEAKFFVNQASESFFEAGKRLLLLKEHEEHGEFIKALDRIGVDARAAQKLMSIAARFADTKALSGLHRTKLFELTVLDDEELAELDKGGTAAGLTFDDVDRMGVRELRGALRQERVARTEDNEANERLIANKDKKINQLTKNAFVPWDERMVALVDELSTCSLAASECLTRVYQVAQAAAVAKLESDDGLLQHQELAARIINDVNLLVQRVAVIQGFAYENFRQYVDNGATPVLGETVDAKAHIVNSVGKRVDGRGHKD
jgi:hypothetical protein